MSENMTIRYHNFVARTKVFGLDERPRAMFWVQGCAHKCPGCMSAETWDFHGGKSVNVETAVNWVLKAPGIVGIVLSGGEVFLQPEAVLCFLKTLKEKSDRDLDVMVYTGFTMKELLAKNDAAINEILSNYVDILVDGRYVEAMNDGCSLRGSSNQEIWLLTDRFSQKDLANCIERKKAKPRKIEVHYSEGRLILVGIPEKQELKRIKEFFDGTKKEKG